MSRRQATVGKSLVLRAWSTLGNALVANLASSATVQAFASDPAAVDQLGAELRRVLLRWLILLVANRTFTTDGRPAAMTPEEREPSVPGTPAAIEEKVSWADLHRRWRNAFPVRTSRPRIGGSSAPFGPVGLGLFDTRACSTVERMRLDDRAMSSTLDILCQYLDWCQEDPVGSAHAILLDLTPQFESFGDQTILQAVPGRTRKAGGSFYTPARIVDALVEATITPKIAEIEQSGVSPEERRKAILDLRICDPACGTGRFLVAAGRKLASAVAPAGTDEWQRAFRKVARDNLFGFDLDPVAVDIASINLWLEAADHVLSPVEAAPNIAMGDSILGPALPYSEAASGEHNAGSLDGKPPAANNDRASGATFRCSTALSGSFDIVLSNPPFRNAIEGQQDQIDKRRLSGRFPALHGAADRSYFFLALAADIVRPGGRIGMVLPRAFLNAAAARDLRANLPDSLRPTFVWAPNRADYFGGASVYACAVALGPEGFCDVSRDDDPLGPSERRQPFSGSNWWRPIIEPAGHMPPSVSRGNSTVGNAFLVTASMTAGEAYRVAPLVVDEEKGVLPKLVTTGLIDPGQCRWGQVECRYLGTLYRHPRIRTDLIADAGLARRAARLDRPKILVAGLSKRIECVLDELGVSLGAVSTFSIYHPDDDLVELRSLESFLLSAEANRLFHSELGCRALAGGNTTMTKAFLRSLPWR